MTITLITGATRGLGREAARQLVQLGHTVYLGARDADRGAQVAAEVGAVPLVIDVTDDESVAAAAKHLAEQAGGLDVLVNNAAIAGNFVPPGQVTAAAVRTVYETNVFGVVRVTGAMLPLLERSAAPVVVNVSSGLGSLGRVTEPGRLEADIVGLAYPSSKTALNMITTMYAKAYPGIRINCVDPGYTATEFNGYRGVQTVAEGTEAIVAMSQLGPDGPTGTFVDRFGTVPW
jgi:NAD(P)-dependent dehydrogenase (short-subunit alcohol dehydrogenase family)